jgi:hypothetical protein
LVSPEPAHHGTAARGVDARAKRASDDQREHEHGKGRRVCRNDETGPASGDSRSEDRALTDPVGEEAPGEQGEDRAAVGGREREAELRQVEVIRVLKRRCEDGNAEKDRGIRRLRARS